MHAAWRYCTGRYTQLCKYQNTIQIYELVRRGYAVFSRVLVAAGVMRASHACLYTGYCLLKHVCMRSCTQ